MHLHGKFQDFPSLRSKVRVITEGWTDRETDTDRGLLYFLNCNRMEINVHIYGLNLLNTD